MRSILGLVGLLITALAFLLGGCFNRHPGTNYQAHAVPGVTSPDPGLRFDVQVDAAGTLHLVWQPSKRPLSYQQSRDGGRTWSNPVELAPVLVGGKSGFMQRTPPRLFMHGDTLSMLWPDANWPEGGLHLRQSYDGGRTWPETPEAAPPEPVAAPHPYISGPTKASYTLVQDGAMLLLTYPGERAYPYRHNYLVRRSLDLGRTWSPPRMVGKRYSSAEHYSWTAATTRGDRWYVLWAEDDQRHVVENEHGSILGSLSRMYLVWSLDGGRTWSAPKEIPIEGLEAYSGAYKYVTDVRNLELHATPEGLWLLFYERGGHFEMLLDAEGRVVQKPRPMNGDYGGGAYRASLLADGSALVGWTTSQYKKQELKLLEMHLWRWNNNDLVVRRVRPGEPEEAWDAPQLMTPYMSISTTPPQFAQLPDGRVLVFWALRHEVEKPEHKRPDLSVELVMTEIE